MTAPTQPCPNCGHASDWNGRFCAKCSYVAGQAPAKSQGLRWLQTVAYVVIFLGIFASVAYLVIVLALRNQLATDAYYLAGASVVVGLAMVAVRYALLMASGDRSQDVESVRMAFSESGRRLRKAWPFALVLFLVSGVLWAPVAALWGFKAATGFSFVMFVMFFGAALGLGHWVGPGAVEMNRRDQGLGLLMFLPFLLWSGVSLLLWTLWDFKGIWDWGQ